MSVNIILCPSTSSPKSALADLESVSLLFASFLLFLSAQDEVLRVARRDGAVVILNKQASLAENVVEQEENTGVQEEESQHFQDQYQL